MVAGIDTEQLFETLEAANGNCLYTDGDLENLSHYLQGYARLPTYHTPILVGYSAGGSFAYANLMQAPEGTFAGAISLGFCVEMDLGKALCKGDGARFERHADGKSVDLLPSPEVNADWVVLQGAKDRVCPTGAARSFVAQLPRARYVELPRASHF